ncbi:Translation factor GUF1 like, chloroplastic [Apostasia shenzhenica]|uniref:Translation factor GUF1 like, chloroplastic n=1 Tax=Apostasia shenzhenica TaxID=1088818 RepID=A0A2I0AZU2_9ASPA|nr:Translation factor GUF1 like, chloroplastic [Apostasia shenzhenica]
MAGLLLRGLRSAGRRAFSFPSTSPATALPSPQWNSNSLRPLRHFAAAASAPAAASVSAGSSLDPSRLRNVAVIAHVDHGKTTLMDRLLRQCGADIPHERAMDSISLERERGITIASKESVTSLCFLTSSFLPDFSRIMAWIFRRILGVPPIMITALVTGTEIFSSSSVERVVGMVEGAVLVVDAGEGPLAQTKFVLAKALKYGLRPILLLNKVDRPSVSEETCNEVESLVFDLFANLGATEEQLDFPVLYASAKEGWASPTYTKSPTNDARNMSPLLDAILEHVPPPSASVDTPFQMLVSRIVLFKVASQMLVSRTVLFKVASQMLVSMMERDFYLGRILTGRISSGVIHVGDRIHGLRKTNDGVEKIEEGKVTKLMKKKGTNVVPIDVAAGGDIISIAGLTSPAIGHTIANVEVAAALPTVELDPPTISMTFSVNDSPLAGRDGTHLTGGKIGDRLMAETETNLAINVIPSASESYEVQGRGELQLGILIENMRREGFELSVSPPRVMYKIENGERLEPIEEVTIEVNEEHVGLVMEALSHRRGEVVDMGPVPGIIEYSKHKGPLGNVRKGVLVSVGFGIITSHALMSLEARGTLFVSPGMETYEGMIVGEHSRDTDLDVNPVRTKELTNIRAPGKDENVRLSPPRLVSLLFVIMVLHQ